MLILIISLALRPRVSLPPLPADFSIIDLKVTGRIVILTNKERVTLERGRHYIEGLKISVEMPEIPLVIDRKGNEIACTSRGDYIIEIKGLSSARKPLRLNLRAALNGYETFYIKGILIPAMPGTVTVPDITLKTAGDNS